MGVPNASSGSLRLGFQFPFLQVLFSGLALDFLQFGPAIAEEFRAEIGTCEFSTSKITRDVIVRRERVDGGECDLLADGQGAKELPRFECPRLSVIEVRAQSSQMQELVRFTSSSRSEVPGRGAWRSARCRTLVDHAQIGAI
jgi:hypothetical protein